jgi:spore coat protein JB
MIVSEEILKRELNEIGFTLWELHLYLDTHPDDAAALAEYNMCAGKHRAAMAHYERLYGPINSISDEDLESWKWIQEPWPWEGDANV